MTCPRSHRWQVLLKSKTPKHLPSPLHHTYGFYHLDVAILILMTTNGALKTFSESPHVTMVRLVWNSCLFEAHVL